METTETVHMALGSEMIFDKYYQRTELFLALRNKAYRCYVNHQLDKAFKPKKEEDRMLPSLPDVDIMKIMRWALGTDVCITDTNEGIQNARAHVAKVEFQEASRTTRAPEGKELTPP